MGIDYWITYGPIGIMLFVAGIVIYNLVKYIKYLQDNIIGITISTIQSNNETSKALTEITKALGNLSELIQANVNLLTYVSSILDAKKLIEEALKDVKAVQKERG